MSTLKENRWKEYFKDIVRYLKGEIELSPEIVRHYIVYLKENFYKRFFRYDFLVSLYYVNPEFYDRGIYETRICLEEYEAEHGKVL